MFEDFKPVILTTGMPTVTFTNNGVTFSKAAIVKLGKPQSVRILLNEAKKQMAIVANDNNSANDTALFFNQTQRRR